MDAQYCTSLEANLWKIKLNFFLTNFFIYSPILFIAFQERGFSYTEIALILIAANATGLLFEVPTGILADRWGRKYLLMLAALCGVAAMLLWTSTVFWIVLLGMVFRSLVDACISGADTALLYETLKELGREKEYARHNGARFTMSMVGFASAALIASVVPKLGSYRLHFIATAGAFLLALLVASSLQEPRHHKRTERTSFAHLRHAFHVSRTHPEIRKIITYTFVLGGSTIVLLTYFQFFMKGAGIDPQRFGLIYAGLALVSAAAAFSAFRIEQRIGERRMLLLIPGLFALGILLLILAKTPAVIIAGLVLIELVLGLKGAVLDAYLQRHLDSEHRSTISSLAGLYGSAYNATLYLTLAVVADGVSIQAAAAVLFAVWAIMILPPLYLMISAGARPREH